MTWHAVQATLLFVALTTQHLWLRPRLRRQIAARADALIGRPLRRHGRNMRRSLIALTRAARHRGHVPVHALHSHGDHHDHHLAA